MYYDSTDEARRAKTSCEGGLDIDGKIARVDYSLTTAPHRPTPGVYMGRKYDDRRRGRAQERAPRYSRYREDDRGSYSRIPRHSGSDVSPMARSARDRSPGRPRHSQRSSVCRRRTMSSSRSRSPPPVYNGSGSRKGPEGSPDISRQPGAPSNSSAGAGGKMTGGAWSDAD